MIREIEDLLRTVAELSRTAKDGWVHWPRIARKLYGAEELTPQCKSIADLPEAELLFIKNERVVRLSPHGWAVLTTLPTGKKDEPLTLQIANAVKEYASTLDHLRFNVESIRRGAQAGNRVVHALFVDTEETFATDTPVTFRSRNGWQTYGKVVGQETDGTAVYVAFENEIFDDCLPGQLVVDRAFLLLKLEERLRRLDAMPLLASELTQSKDFKEIKSVNGQDAVAVADQLVGLPIPWAKFLWGPPGAGKTYSIGRLLARLLQDSTDERHLVIAPSNRAVDVAVFQFLLNCKGVKQLENMIADRRILRFGYARKQEILNRPELLGPANLNELTRTIKDFSQRIRQAEETHESEEKLSGMRAELLTVQEQLRERVQDHIQDSAVVFTTSTLAYLGSQSNPIPDMKWSSVLVDEVTMVPPAQCAFLGSLACSRFLLGGDPRQLGPIFEVRSGRQTMTEWMGWDIFEKSGISKGNGEARTVCISDSRLTRIDTQRRCCAGIWAEVKSKYPKVSCSVNEESLKWITDLPPASGKAVVVLDTSRTDAHCQRAHESWRNPVSAETAMEVACTAVGESKRNLSIAIITPYRAQVRDLRKRLRQEARSENPAYGGIEAGTVHQFQGSDADFVIFDLVDGRDRSELGLLLQGDTGRRLVNVAITRARGKVVIIVDRIWFRSKASREQNPLLWDLILGCEGDAQLPVAPPVYSREQENCESPIEATLLAAMRKHNRLSKIVTQFEIKDKLGKLVSRADFAFPRIKYAVYCDSAEWHLRPDRWQKDLRQRNELSELGWIFSVFTGAEINQNADDCASKVSMTFQNRLKQLGRA